MGFTRQEFWSGLPFPSPGDLLNPGIEPRSPALHADSLLSESSGEPKNTGVGSLTILQGIFPTQKSNQSLLHCRQILYQLSYQGSPWLCMWGFISGLSLLFCCLYVCLYANTILFWLSSFVIYFEVRKCGASSFVSFSNCFGYVRSFLCEF